MRICQFTSIKRHIRSTPFLGLECVTTSQKECAAASHGQVRSARSYAPKQRRYSDFCSIISLAALASRFIYQATLAILSSKLRASVYLKKTQTLYFRLPQSRKASLAEWQN
jgi:hypothetical protein